MGGSAQRRAIEPVLDRWPVAGALEQVVDIPHVLLEEPICKAIRE